MWIYIFKRQLWRNRPLGQPELSFRYSQRGLPESFVGFDVSRAASSTYVVDVPKDGDDLSPLDKVRISNSYANTRTPSSAEAHCVLNKLTYPTGGYTEFHFENHEFFTFTDYDGDYIHNKKDVSKPKLPVSGFMKSSIIRQKVYEVTPNTTVTGKLIMTQTVE